MKHLLKILITYVIAMSFILSPCLIYAQAQSLNWHDINKKAVELLLADDLISSARSYSDTPTTGSLDDMLFRLNILLRAGHRSKSFATIRSIGISKQILSPFQVGQVVNDLFKRDEYELARLMFESCPDVSNTTANPLIKYWLANNNPDDEIDRWISERIQTSPEFWIQQRVRFRASRGTADEVIEELASAVRQAPADFIIAKIFLESTQAAGGYDVNWVGQVFASESPFELLALARNLERAHHAYQGAAILYQRCLNLVSKALGKSGQELEQAKYIGNHRSYATIKIEAKEGLAYCLLKMGDIDKARLLIKEALEERKNTGLPTNIYLSGEFKEAIGLVATEQELLAEEKTSSSSPEYWLQRARFYEASNDVDKVEFALRKVLLLLSSDLIMDDSLLQQQYNNAAGDLVRLFQKQGRHQDAVSFLIHELKSRDPGINSTAYCAYLFVSSFRSEVGQYGDVLWQFIDAKPKWSPGDIDVLKSLVENVNQGQRQEIWEKIENMIINADTSRGIIAGASMIQMNEPARAIPFLKSAIERSVDPELNAIALLNLFDAYIQTGLWREAEQLFNNIYQSLSPEDIPLKIENIAFAAARQGMKDEAIRLWKVRANIELTDLRKVADFAHLGMKHALISFYQNIKSRDADSWVPDEALKIMSAL